MTSSPSHVQSTALQGSFWLIHQPPAWPCPCRPSLHPGNSVPGSLPGLLQDLQLLSTQPRGPPTPTSPCPWALTPDHMDTPGEGAECGQHTIGPPRSSPAHGVADKLPDRLQRLALTGVRLDLAVCVDSTRPMEKTGSHLLPPLWFLHPLPWAKQVGAAGEGLRSAPYWVARLRASPLYRPCPA